MELRATRNKLDKYLENSLKQDQDSKMSQMKALTSLQVAAVKYSNKLEFKAQSQLMQRRNKKERFSGLHINDSHNFSDIMQQFSTSMGTSFMGRQQSPWQQQSTMPMMQQGLPNYMMQQQQSMMPMMQQPNYMIQHGMMQQVGGGV